MNNLIQNSSELKLQLFRFIDTLPENKLQRFYNLLVLNQEHEDDFWDFLSEWEKDDIQAGISDLENGRFKNIEEVLSKY